MANYWLHNGYVEVEGRKMSKSEGNFIKVKDIVFDKYQGSILRLAMLQTYYRKNFNWTKDLYNRSKAEYLKWLSVTSSIVEIIEVDLTDFFVALADDLNTVKAITIMREYYKNKQYMHLYHAMKFLNFELEKREVPAYIIEKLKRRIEAVANNNWGLADILRAQIEEAGYMVQDIKNADGTRDSLII